MYIHKDIAFRVLERQDLEVLRQLHNDPSTWVNLLNIDFIDEEDQLEWWNNLHKTRNDKRYVICFAKKPKEIIGRLRIQNINYLHNNCEVGLDILLEHRGKGYALESYKMLIEFLFNQLNMNMIYLKVADFNPIAKKLYEKAGFKETGRLPNYFFRHGKYWDYIVMSVIKK